MKRGGIAALLLMLLVATGVRAEGLEAAQRGEQLHREQRYEAAVEAYTRAIVSGELDPETLAIVYNNRGVAYNAIGDYDRAIADYQESLTLAPGDEITIRNLRIALTRRAVAVANAGKYEEALEDLGKAIELEPSHPLAWLRRAQVYMELGQLERARHDLEEARRRGADPRDVAEAARRLAVLEEAAKRALLAPPPPPTTELAARAARNGDTSAPPPPAAQETAAVAAVAPAAGPAAGVNDAAAPAEARSTAASAASRWRARAHVNARKGPGNRFEVLRVARKGEELLVVGEQRGWKKVRFDDGTEAWIYRKWLEPVAPPATAGSGPTDARPTPAAGGGARPARSTP